MEKKNLGSLRSVSIFGSLWLIRSEISDYLVRARQWERSHRSDLSVSMIKSDRSHWTDPRAAWKRSHFQLAFGDMELPTTKPQCTINYSIYKQGRRRGGGGGGGKGTHPPHP